MPLTVCQLLGLIEGRKRRREETPCARACPSRPGPGEPSTSLGRAREESRGWVPRWGKGERDETGWRERGYLVSNVRSYQSSTLAPAVKRDPSNVIEPKYSEDPPRSPLS
eukprot:1437500-Rhodomonas_salina.2